MAVPSAGVEFDLRPVCCGVASPSCDAGAPRAIVSIDQLPFGEESVSTPVQRHDSRPLQAGFLADHASRCGGGGVCVGARVEFSRGVTLSAPPFFEVMEETEAHSIPAPRDGCGTPPMVCIDVSALEYQLESLCLTS
jgi:hypothetical protein